MGTGGGGMGAGGMGAGGTDTEATDAGAETQTATVVRRNRNPTPEYNEVGKALADRYDPSYDNPALACSASLLFGIGHHSLANEFVKLSETEYRLTYGYMDMVRTIHVDGNFPANIAPSVSGYSVGKWEQDTLVITTRGFKPGVLFAFAGSPGAGISTVNSEELEVVETIRHDQSADRLDYTWTATDAGYWTAPLNGERTFSRAVPYEVYGCIELAGENNIRENGETLFEILPANLKSTVEAAPAPRAPAVTPAPVEKPVVETVTPSAPVISAPSGNGGATPVSSPPEAKSSISSFLVLGGVILAFLLLIGLAFKRSKIE